MEDVIFVVGFTLLLFLLVLFNSIGIWYVDQKGLDIIERSLVKTWEDIIIIYYFRVYTFCMDSLYSEGIQSYLIRFL